MDGLPTKANLHHLQWEEALASRLEVLAVKMLVEMPCNFVGAMLACDFEEHVLLRRYVKGVGVRVRGAAAIV
jgi:hypothetical protein